LTGLLDILIQVVRSFPQSLQPTAGIAPLNSRNQFPNTYSLLKNVIPCHWMLYKLLSSKDGRMIRNCREHVRPINARSGVTEYLRRLRGRASWTCSDLRSSGWEACATRIITLTSEVDEQNTEHSVHYGNTGFLFVQNIIAISPT